MLSTQYRLRLEYICNRISKGHEVQLEDMMWATKLAKANQSAGEMMRKARRSTINVISMVYRLLVIMCGRFRARERGTSHAKAFRQWLVRTVGLCRLCQV